VLKGRKLTAIEIKSAKTFQPEFAAGIKHFASSIAPRHIVEGRVWYDGELKTTYHDVSVSNPLLHGMEF
jgi:hypothetical protein